MILIIGLSVETTTLASLFAFFAFEQEVESMIDILS